MKNYILLSFLITLLNGCASDYPCGEPRTGRCSSIAENYQRSNQPIVNPEDKPINPYENCSSGNCSSSSSNTTSNSSSSTWFSSNDKAIPPKYPQIHSNSSPLVSTPNMMRVWIMPYVDADNIYHDQGYQYMLVDRGHWLFGTNNIFGRGKSFKELTTNLAQDTNPSQTEDSGGTNKQTSPNTTHTTSSMNNNLNTPALNYLKQQDQTNISSMGLGK